MLMQIVHAKIDDQQVVRHRNRSLDYGNLSVEDGFVYFSDIIFPSLSITHGTLFFSSFFFRARAHDFNQSGAH